jgi:photosystem II stability/assembly factor-like uncharacterized protein
MGNRGIILLACCFAAPAVADTLPADVIKLVVDPSTPATLYAAAGTSSTDQGIYKSTDAGLTWTLVFQMADRPRSLAIDPLTPSTLYVADAAANLPADIYKSTDGGASWNGAGSGIQQKPGVGGPDVIDYLAVDPVDEGTLYAASNNTGLYKSTDGGQSWTRINQGLSAYVPGNAYIHGAMLIDPVVPTTLYISMSGVSLADIGLYISTDGGSTWSLFAFSEIFPVELAIDPEDDLHLVACVGSIASSLDGGVTWTSGPTCGGLAVFDPYYSDHILVAGGSTIVSSSDGGATFGAASLSGPLMNGLVFDPVVPSNVYAATASGLYISRDDGATWTVSTSAASQVLPIHVPADEATIQAAIDAAPAADSVVVAPGTYKEQLDFKGKFITVKSSGGAAVTILDGNSTGPIVHFHSGETPATVLQGLTLQDASDVPGAGSAILIASASPSIEDDVFTDDQEDDATGSAISGSQTSAVIVRDYFTANTCGTGSTDGVISFTSNSSPIVADDVFANNACAAYAQTIASGTASQVYNDTFVGNTAGLSLPGYAAADTALTITQNIIAFNQVGVDTPGYSGTTMPAFSFNLVYGDTTADYVGVHDQTGGFDLNISADPLFVDQADGDFHLQWLSPAMFAGNYPESGIPEVTQVSATDFYGQSRVTLDFGIVTSLSLGAAEFHLPVITAMPGSLVVFENSTITGTLGASVMDPAGQLYAVVTRPAHGSVILTDPTQLTGGFKYVPAHGYLGTDSFTFDITNTFGVVSNTATESITVEIQPLTANAGSVSVKADGNVAGSLTASAPAGETYTFSLASNPAHGAVSLNARSGDFSYKPVVGYAGTDSFSFTVTQVGGSGTSTAAESITVTDTAPTVGNTSIIVSPLRAYTGTLPLTLAYRGQTVRFKVVSAPHHGTATITGPETGSFTYSPVSHFAGVDSFTVEAVDQGGTASNLATVSVKVL